MNTAIMIDARGGTGGGLFRYMYARFLEEAAELTGEKRLAEIGKCMQDAGDMWQAAAELFERAYEGDDPGQVLEKVCTILPHIAKEEELAWLELEKLLT